MESSSETFESEERPDFAAIYADLRRLAELRLADERAGHSLSVTALVHETYLRIGPAVDDLVHERHAFFAAAATAMRRVLIEHARRRSAIKRGGDRHRVELFDVPVPLADDRLLELDAALTRLGEEDPLAARAVELRFFAGLGHEDVAQTLGLSVYAARDKWTYARAWLNRELGG